jgi:type III restriction enzyme
MNYFEPKDYQKQVLHSISQYFEKCRELKNPDLAFYKMTQVSYQPLKGFAEGMPYFCLRVPTGGGKTWLAATSIQLINRLLLRTEHSVILWLVPSNQIRQQTLQGLKDREHPLHAALLTAGAVTILSLDEAKSVTPATLNTSTTVIVATRQAFQVASEENRKVYENNGALMAHFDNLNAEQKRNLLKDGDTTPYSLANVLRLRRPFVIVDEAHNNRTELGFDTLAKFNPSGIMELTATPDLIKTPSNVLHSVSAVELKTEQMIKLPILLQAESDWQKCLLYALTCRNDLQALADKDYQRGGNYLRPIVLIQAEPKKAGVETRDVFKVKQELIDNHNIPEEEIIIATGEEKGLMKVAADYPLGIKDTRCPVKFVITQKALAEGWDCPFAYILVSIANVHSSTAVEQLLGRILRQPDAVHRHAPELNQSYSFVVSSNFTATAAALKDSLVNSAGFDRKEVGDFVKARQPTQHDLQRYTHKNIPPIVTPLPEKPNLTKLPKAVKEKVTWQEDTQTLTTHNALTDEDKEALKATVQEDATKTIIDEMVEESRVVAFEYFKTPFERGIKLRVPQLSVYVQGELQVFDDAEMLDYPWDLARYAATPTENELSQFSASLKHRVGTIDINAEHGKVETGYIDNLQRDLDLVYQPEHWGEVQLAAWLCRNLPNRYVTHSNKLAFVAAWLTDLIARFDLATVNQQRFFIRTLLEQRINDLRKSAISSAYQETLFEKQAVTMCDSAVFEIPAFYSPNKYYDASTSKYGSYPFRHHYHGQIGEFDSKEEFACACYLDRLAEEKKIQCWLRNLSRGNGAFFLQKATDKFYPDFVCLLPDESILIVEYKGGDRWKEAEPDRLIAALWASLSNGRCHFIMLKNQEFHQIDSVIESVKVCLN